MSLRTQDRRSPAELRNELGVAQAASAELVSAALDLMAARCAMPNRADQAARIRELIGAQAWTDAVLAIVDLDHSRAVRRLIHDDGEWSCRIGSRWAVPDWLDDSVEFSHPVLPLAVLGALVDALRQAPATIRSSTSVPQSHASPAGSIPAVSCENYL